jgi:hypothetical protein
VLLFLVWPQGAFSSFFARCQLTGRSESAQEVAREAVKQFGVLNSQGSPYTMDKSTTTKRACSSFPHVRIVKAGCYDQQDLIPLGTGFVKDYVGQMARIGDRFVDRGLDNRGPIYSFGDSVRPFLPAKAGAAIPRLRSSRKAAARLGILALNRKSSIAASSSACK